jgi:lipopolysaccharide/colanic/teichoic acid biosynthesis glycosyltransferase
LESSRVVFTRDGAGEAAGTGSLASSHRVAPSGAGPSGAVISLPRLRRPPPSSTSCDRQCRALDLVVATAGLLFVAPLLIVLMALIWANDGGAPLYAQWRIGRGGRTFRCLKLRTMVIDSEARLQQLLAADPAARAEWQRDFKLRRDPRITALGRFLRETSLDELPQLINVLRGEMSVVGPRPIVTAEIQRYGRRFGQYCSVPPGITGLWQVSGRNDVSYRRRVALDVTYAKRRSLATNVLIMVATVPVMIFRKGGY